MSSTAGVATIGCPRSEEASRTILDATLSRPDPFERALLAEVLPALAAERPQSWPRSLKPREMEQCHVEPQDHFC